MKTIKYFKLTAIFALFGVLLLSPALSNAQDSKNYYLNGDWRFNATPGNDFANVASGWGMGFDAGYYVTDNIGIGLFLDFGTNHKYVPTKTMQFGTNGTLTTNQQRSLFQLPFGAGVRYRIVNKSLLEPYFGLKLGADYAKMSSYFGQYKMSKDIWGFYVSPEIGTNIWLTPNQTLGVNVSIYYSYSTSSGTILKTHIGCINNIGFKLGLAF